MQVSLRRSPPATALHSDYLQNWSQVQRFYEQPYSLDSIASFARNRVPLTPAHRATLCSVLERQQSRWGAGQRGVEKLAAGAVAVVTGQQPVLFTGPLFSIFKAISAIQIARRLEQNGIPAVPVFWVAAEDHDFKEIEATWILGRNGELRRIGVDLSGADPLPAGWLAYHDDVRVAVEQCIAELPQSEFVGELKAILDESYRPGDSPVDAFARMMARLFAGSELTFISPLEDELRALAQPTIEKAIRSNAEMRSALMTRNRDLSAAGYHEQVKVDENFTGLFAFRGHARHVLRPEELETSIRWSPNVLLRPVVQDTLLPTVTYIAGPAEVAYFAQAAAVYQTVGIPMPPIFPRISATVLEPRIARTAEKYGIDLDDVLLGREHLKRKAVGAMESGDVFARLVTRLDEELESLRSAMSAVDATLVGALDTARQKMLHQVEALKGKYVNAVARRDETVERQLDLMCNSLYPDKKPQERVLNISSLIARYGLGVIQVLMDRVQLDANGHQVIEL